MEVYHGTIYNGDNDLYHSLLTTNSCITFTSHLSSITQHCGSSQLSVEHTMCSLPRRTFRQALNKNRPSLAWWSPQLISMRELGLAHDGDSGHSSVLVPVHAGQESQYGKNQQLELDRENNWLPVELLENRGDMMSPSSTWKQPYYSIFWVQLNASITPSKAAPIEHITVTKPGCDKGNHVFPGLSNSVGQVPALYVSDVFFNLPGFQFTQGRWLIWCMKGEHCQSLCCSLLYRLGRPVSATQLRIKRLRSIMVYRCLGE